MKKFGLFPTPVIEFDFTNHSSLPILLDIINNTKTNFHPLVKNGESSHGKHNILFDPKLISLRNDFQKCADLYCNELKIINVYVNLSWVNVMNNKGKTSVHHHGSSIISGAFYPLLEENTCNLVFRSPLYTALNFIPIKSTIANHFQDDFVMPIKENHLYIFPSWLQHYTEENKGNKRIVVSFNTKFY